jgi:hypothetical protein
MKAFLVTAPGACVSASAGSSSVASTSEHSPTTASLADFEAAMAADIPIADLMADHLQRLRARNARLRTEAEGRAVIPRSIKLLVTVRMPDPRPRAASFGEEGGGYTEMQEREFDNKVRIFSFHEDQRPAWVCTFSKKSLVISGRRPFARDRELINYDSDSEEDVGEDVDSSDPAAAGGREHEFDEFLCRDDDFGMETDHDPLTISVFVPHTKMEVVGPRFINAPVVMAFSPTHTPTLSQALGGRGPNVGILTYAVMEGGVWMSRPVSEDPDANALMKYCAVAFPCQPPPYLGRGAKRALSVDGEYDSS